jgi:hypothetical protein
MTPEPLSPAGEIRSLSGGSRAADTDPGRTGASVPQPPRGTLARTPSPVTRAASGRAAARGRGGASRNTASRPGDFAAAGAGTSAGGTPERTSVLSAGQAAIAAAMSEDRGPDSLDAHVRRLMKDLGLTGFHVERSLDVEKNRKNVSVKGWLDWTIRGPRGVLFRELKSQRGRVEPEQREWLDALAADGADADVWRPACLLTGRITAELAAISGLRGVPRERR